MSDGTSPKKVLRCLHIDFKGLAPTFKRMMQLVGIIKKAGFNAVLLEFEDVFPWVFDPAFRAKHHYSKKQVKHLCKEIRACEIEIIPLVQCLGHMEMVLSIDAYALLRECHNRTDVINPLLTASGDLLIKMYSEVIELCGSNRYFCIGGDEVATLGSNPKTTDYIKEHSEAKLYLRHVSPLCQWLIDKGIRPLLWADMMMRWPESQLVELGNYADICVWGYQKLHFEKDMFNSHPSHIERFTKSGIKLWAAAAYKGAEQDDSDLPDYEKRSDNMKQWLELSKNYCFEGIISTGWSRFSTNRLQCEPIDTALDSLVNHGQLLKTSKPLYSENLLVEILGTDEFENFNARKELLREFDLYRKSAWTQIRIIHELISSFEANPARFGCGSAVTHLQWLKVALTKLNSVAIEVQSQWNGLVNDKAIADYIFVERINPIEKQKKFIEQQLEWLRKKNPQNLEP